ncbi:uncharacterized protein LOC110431766 [Sorghum bicolor]|uniref:uncharacterized protein LOC110431766 n=1 Tax=Sorghum bicolor TaxID=4558 RepID=UPI000B424E79|nr:uncharacterized protein LOC110431766 [Sorghum bicolor]|eukprot:XP_021306993.1 uncharacterized protein LOC110431766 [Sorghum bicolor]
MGHNVNSRQPPPCQPPRAKFMRLLAAHQDENCSPLSSDFCEEDIHDSFGREGFVSAREPHGFFLLPPLATPPSHEAAATTASGRPHPDVRAPPRHPPTALSLSLSHPCDVYEGVTLECSSIAVVSLLVRRRHLHLHCHSHLSRRSVSQDTATVDLAQMAAATPPLLLSLLTLISILRPPHPDLARHLPLQVCRKLCEKSRLNREKKKRSGKERCHEI